MTDPYAGIAALGLEPLARGWGNTIAQKENL